MRSFGPVLVLANCVVLIRAVRGLHNSSIVHWLASFLVCWFQKVPKGSKVQAWFSFRNVDPSLGAFDFLKYYLNSSASLNSLLQFILSLPSPSLPLHLPPPPSFCFLFLHLFFFLPPGKDGPARAAQLSSPGANADRLDGSDPGQQRERRALHKVCLLFFFFFMCPVVVVVVAKNVQWVNGLIICCTVRLRMRRMRAAR